MNAPIFLKTSRERKQWTIAVVLTVILSIGLLRLPLLNYLGYEYSAAVSLAVPWLCGGLTIGSLRSRFGGGPAPHAANITSSIGESIARSIILLIIPYLSAGINAAFVKNCSFAEGTGFYLLLPVITAIWSTFFAVFCYTVTRRAILLFVSAHILILLYPIYAGYAQPQIFSYNIVYGYFPGFSYDEVLPITGTLILFRGLTLAAGIFFLAFSLLRGRWLVAPSQSGDGNSGEPVLLRKSVLITLIFITFIFLSAGWYYRTELGFESSEDRLRHVLSTLTVTEHFRIYTAPGDFTVEQLSRVAAEHEFRYAQVTAALQTYPAQPVTSYLYPDDETKRQLLGTATTSIAKPWLREIHLSGDSWRQLLKHELTHVVAGEFGMPVIRANYHIGLVEGLAMSVDPRFGNRTLHQYSSSLLHFGIVRDPVALINPAGFALGYSSVSYVLMGSFCQYLRARYGNIRFKEYYGGRSPESIFGRTAAQLVADWQLYLQKVTVPDSSRKHLDF
jgi:hypothetical protein